MKKAGLVVLAIMLAASLAPAQQQDNTPRVDKREARQQKRIDQGVKSGQLTTKEANKLEKEQARVKKNEAKAKADGKVTPRERKKLTREQNKASRDIYRLKHNQKKAVNKPSGQ